MINNYIINEEENSILIKVNKNIYNKEIITQTTYVLLDKYYFLIDEDEKNWLIHIKFKDEIEENDGKKENKIMTEKNALEFFDELIESSSYIDQLKRTKKIREMILEKAILSQTIEDINDNSNN